MNLEAIVRVGRKIVNCSLQTAEMMSSAVPLNLPYTFVRVKMVLVHAVQWTSSHPRSRQGQQQSAEEPIIHERLFMILM